MEDRRAVIAVATTALNGAATSQKNRLVPSRKFRALLYEFDVGVVIDEPKAGCSVKPSPPLMYQPGVICAR